MFTASMFSKSGSSVAVTSLLLFLMSGCASEPPKEEISKADIAIQDADRAGAGQYEPDLLSSARTKLNRANKDMDNDENDEARSLAEEALSEAMLASAKAEAAKQAKETKEMKKTIEALKHETSRETEGQ